MRKVLLEILALSCFCFTAKAQLYDKNWIYGSFVKNDSTWFRGNGLMTFVSDSVYAHKEQFNMPMSESTITISNADGELLFYSNGMRIMDSTKTLVTNGDSLSYGEYWDFLYPQLRDGYYGFGNPNNLLYIQISPFDSVGYLFHIQFNTYDTDSGSYFCLTRMGLTPDIHIIEKNKIISSTEAPAYSNMAACKHANGRDWWVTYQEVNTNCYLKYLLTPDTLMRVDKQCLGDTVFEYNSWGARFSMDGSKYVSVDAFSGLNLFDFDRCNGQFYNPRHLSAPVSLDSANNNIYSWATSVAFSPSGRFLYTIMPDNILQYDLDAQDIEASRDTIAELYLVTDSVVNGNRWFYYYSSTYGLDGKLYIGPSVSQRSFCVINYPDSLGTSCQFAFEGFKPPTIVSWIQPYYPNYRLGRLPGSVCDTIYSDIKPIYTQTPWLKVYPNPATDIVRFDYNWVEWDAVGACQLVLADLQGRVVFSQSLSKYSARLEVNLKNLPSGVYIAFIQNEKRQLAVCKVMKE